MCDLSGVIYGAAAGIILYFTLGVWGYNLSKEQRDKETRERADVMARVISRIMDK